LNVLAKKQKKIVHIITGLNDGGAEAVLYRLCKYDTTNTHVVISMMDQGKYGPLLCDCGIDVHCLGMPRRKLKLKGLYRLRKHLKKERPDVIQTWMYPVYDTRCETVFAAFPCCAS
jgi:hypothetical protein